MSCSSREEEMLCDMTPPEILTEAQNASESLLPPKSKETYMAAYEKFIQWKNNKKAQSFSENVFLAYFNELASKYKPSSLWCTYSMLKSTVRNKNNIDVKTYCNLTAFLKRRSNGYIGRKSKVLSSSDVERFLKEAPDSHYLATKITMGGWLSYLWWGGDPDAVNAMSGLTRREVYAVQKSWAPVYANSVANGTELLKRLFRAYPETKEFFKMVRKLPEEEFAANIQFKAHVINLMDSLQQAVANLNQPELVAAMMRRIGESHSKRQIKETHFHNLKDVIVKMFVEVLKLDDATLGAWAKTVTFWYKHVFETLNEAR